MASTTSDIQKILVSLSTADIEIEPGSTAQLIVSMTNRQEEPDRLSIEVEGIDVEWYAIPVPVVHVAPGATVTERILFKVARNSANRAGSYPFLVRVQAQETGEVGVAQAALVVKSFSFLEVELDPKRAVATFFRPLNDFDVAVSNQGNAEQTLDLGAFDPDDACAYEFDTDRITLKPGQTTVVPLALRPKVSSILGGVRLYGFTLSARSVSGLLCFGECQRADRETCADLAAHGHLPAVARLRRRRLCPVPTPSSCACCHPLFQRRADQGRLRPADHALLGCRQCHGDRPLPPCQKRQSGGGRGQRSGGAKNKVGTVQVKPEYPKSVYKLSVRDANGKEVGIREVVVEVGAPPVPQPAKVKSFSAEPTRIHAGDTVRLSWEATSYTQAIVDPGNNVLSVYQRTMNVLPDQTTTYIFRAIGADQKPVEKRVTITVIPKDQCIATLDSFGLKSQDVYIGEMAHLKWKSSYAKTAHLSADNGGYSKDVNLSDSIGIPVNGPTVFTLTVTDSAGLSVSKQVTVKPVPKPTPPDPTPPTPDGGGTTVVPPTPGTTNGTGTGTTPPPQ